MSATAHQQLSDALLARLLSPPALAFGRVYANRFMPLPQGRVSMVVLRRDQTALRTSVLGGPLNWTSTYAVECYGRGTAGEDPAGFVDDLLAQVWARLFGLTPADLPGLGVMDIAADRAIDWQFDEAETPMACATVRFSVHHRTTADLEPRS